MIRRALQLLIRVYQLAISPWLPAACRFEPSCSSYGTQALEEHGLRPGLGLILRRLLRCRPGGGWGYDPVPRSGVPQLEAREAGEMLGASEAR